MIAGAFKPLDFVLHEWTRTIWTSAEARMVWEPRFSACSTAWNRLEMLAVAAGVRPSALQHVSMYDMPQVSMDAAEQGLCLIPLEQRALVPDSYSSSAQSPEPGKPVCFVCAVTRPEMAGEWNEAWKTQKGIGALLGYPECCREFFQRVWIDEGRVDTTWWMAQNGGSDGPPESNIMLRWLGVRLASHLPCSFNCQATYEQSLEWQRVARENGLGREIDWAREALSWPMEWSGLHGIAEIRTPVCKVSTRTDASAERLTVRREGDRYPDEGATGIKFPYRESSKTVTGSRSFANALDVVPHEPWAWELNGFASLTAMREAHLAILDAMEPFDDYWRAQEWISDPGCGTGALLAAVCKRWPNLRPWGCDTNEEAVRRARGEFPDGVWLVRNMFEPGSLSDMPPGPALFMPGRLRECPEGDREALLGDLTPRRLIVNLYGDWIDGDDALEKLCEEVGLGEADLVGTVLRRGTVAQVAVIEVGGASKGDLRVHGR